MPQANTKTRILDAAEKLFAQEGFHNTSLRAITGQAGVNLAAVNYHFGSKDALLQAVFERRLRPLNEERRERLEGTLAAAAAAGRAPQTAELLRAFIEPTLALRNAGPGAKEFIALIGRALSEPDETVRDCFLQQVLPIFKLLYGGLQQALPQLPEALLFTRLQFTMGAMSQVMCASARPGLQLPGSPPPLEEAQLVEELIRFIGTGLEAPC